MAIGETARKSGTTLSPEVIQSLGTRIFEAEKERRMLEPLTSEHPGMSVEDAYAVQVEYARLKEEAGSRLIGHKIGATSKAIQELFDIDTPDYGHLFDDMQCSESELVSISTLIQPLVEPEIAFVLSKDLRGPGVTADDVMKATSGVVACLEIIDSRIDDWRIKLADTISDNGSSARFIVSAKEMPASFDLATETVEMTRNGEVVGRGTGSDVLGHPATSVAWLANELGSFGKTLPAGSIALSGSITSAVQARPGDEFVAEFANLGTVRCEIAKD